MLQPIGPGTIVTYEPGPAAGSAPTTGSGADMGIVGSTASTCSAAAVSMSRIDRSSLAFEIFSTPSGPSAERIMNPWSRSLPSGAAVPTSPNNRAASSAAASWVNEGGSPRSTSPAVSGPGHGP